MFSRLKHQIARFAAIDQQVTEIVACTSMSDYGTILTAAIELAMWTPKSIETYLTECIACLKKGKTLMKVLLGSIYFMGKCRKRLTNNLFCCILNVN